MSDSRRATPRFRRSVRAARGVLRNHLGDGGPGAGRVAGAGSRLQPAGAKPARQPLGGDRTPRHGRRKPSACAQVGIDILKAGGNAIDAAVAVNATLGLVEPHMNGVGGDMFALVWDAETEQLYGLNATGRAPYEINRETVTRQGRDRMPGTGPLTWTVPGAVDGWDQILTRFGTMGFAEVLAPAIAYATEGFPVSEIISRDWAASERSLAEWPTSAATYLPNGRAPRAGEVFKNPGLAATYQAIAQGGRDAFYHGRSPARSSPSARPTAATTRCATSRTIARSGWTRSRRAIGATTSGRSRQTARASSHS